MFLFYWLIFFFFFGKIHRYLNYSHSGKCEIRRFENLIQLQFQWSQRSLLYHMLSAPEPTVTGHGHNLNSDVNDINIYYTIYKNNYSKILRIILDK